MEGFTFLASPFNKSDASSVAKIWKEDAKGLFHPFFFPPLHFPVLSNHTVRHASHQGSKITTPWAKFQMLLFFFFFDKTDVTI